MTSYLSSIPVSTDAVDDPTKYFQLRCLTLNSWSPAILPFGIQDLAATLEVCDRGSSWAFASATVQQVLYLTLATETTTKRTERSQICLSTSSSPSNLPKQPASTISGGGFETGASRKMVDIKIQPVLSVESGPQTNPSSGCNGRWRSLLLIDWERCLI